MTKRRENKKLLFTLLILIMLVMSVMGGRFILSAFAATNNYSNALTDLQKDESFKISSYPDKPKDYSLNVIQIAESVDGELFVYTYQPCQKTTYLIATEINMSLSASADGTKLYELTLLNSSGVFCKYKVEGVTVSSATTRYYNITSIYRDWIDGIDKATSNDNDKTSKYFKVGKLFTATTDGSAVKYSCKNVDVIEIKNPYVDFLSYGKQSGWDYIFGVTKWTDIHYIAFSTDKKIDELKEADVTYTTQPYNFTGKNAGANHLGYVYGEKSEPQYTTLTGEGNIGIDGHTEYTWKNIYRSDEFMKTTELTGAAKDEVEKSEFVLVFLKTAFTEQDKWSWMQGDYKVIDGVKVADVSILRLMFETDGVCYNLGALMDKQNGDDIAGNKPEHNSLGFWAYIWRCIVRLFNGSASLVEQVVAVVAIFICALGLPILLTVLSLCIPAFGAVMKSILKALLSVITTPFRFLAWLFGKLKGG